MAVRVRKDGRIVCAASHVLRVDDRAYIDDGLHYKLSVELGVLVSEPMETALGRGGHKEHGEWWWADEVPDDVFIEPR